MAIRRKEGKASPPNCIAPTARRNWNKISSPLEKDRLFTWFTRLYFPYGLDLLYSFFISFHFHIIPAYRDQGEV